jgi:hypothetical protein
MEAAAKLAPHKCPKLGMVMIRQTPNAREPQMRRRESPARYGLGAPNKESVSPFGFNPHSPDDAPISATRAAIQI